MKRQPRVPLASGPVYGLADDHGRHSAMAELWLSVHGKKIRLYLSSPSRTWLHWLKPYTSPTSSGSLPIFDDPGHELVSLQAGLGPTAICSVRLVVNRFPFYAQIRPHGMSLVDQSINVSRTGLSDRQRGGPRPRLSLAAGQFGCLSSVSWRRTCYHTCQRRPVRKAACASSFQVSFLWGIRIPRRLLALARLGWRSPFAFALP